MDRWFFVRSGELHGEKTRERMASRAAAALLPRAPPAAQCSAWLRARASPLPKFCAARISTALPRATSRYMSVQPRGIALHGRRWARAASSEASPHAQDEAAARKFLMDDLGYRAALADAVIASLKAPGSGAPPTPGHSGVRGSSLEKEGRCG